MSRRGRGGKDIIASFQVVFTLTLGPLLLRFKKRFLVWRQAFKPAMSRPRQAPHPPRPGPFLPALLSCPGPAGWGAGCGSPRPLREAGAFVETSPRSWRRSTVSDSSPWGLCCTAQRLGRALHERPRSSAEKLQHRPVVRRPCRKGQPDPEAGLRQGALPGRWRPC